MRVSQLSHPVAKKRGKGGHPGNLTSEVLCIKNLEADAAGTAPADSVTICPEIEIEGGTKAVPVTLRAGGPTPPNTHRESNSSAIGVLGAGQEAENQIAKGQMRCRILRLADPAEIGLQDIPEFEG